MDMYGCVSRLTESLVGERPIVDCPFQRYCSVVLDGNGYLITYASFRNDGSLEAKMREVMIEGLENDVQSIASGYSFIAITRQNDIYWMNSHISSIA